MTAAPVIPKAEEVYDAIMRDIEPDLVTDQLPLLAEKYKDESEEEKELRRERYKKAYALYDERFAEANKRLFDQIRQYKKDQIEGAEEKARQENELILNDLEEAINAL